VIERSMFVLAVPDLAVSAAWYREVMGFEVHEIGDPGWRIFERGACRIMAGHCPDATPPRELGDHSYFGYLVVSDATALFTEVSSKGADVLKPLRDEPWGMREFLLRTADGHRLMVGQNLD